MKGKLPKSKPPLSRRKTKKAAKPEDNIDRNTCSNTEGSEHDNPQRDGLETLSPKSKCFKTKINTKLTSLPASSSNDGQLSAFDYNSDGSSHESESQGHHVGVKRKWSSNHDGGSTDSSCRYRKSQHALNDINKTDKEVKKTRVPKSCRTSNSSDEEDFDKPVKKPCLSLPHDETLKAPQGLRTKRNKKTQLQLKKIKPTTVGACGSAEGNTEEYSKQVEIANQVVPISKLIDQENDGEKVVVDNNSSDSNTLNPCNSNQQDCGDIKEDLKCPVCKKVFDTSKELSKVNEHVNNCIDGKTEDIVDIPETVQNSESAQSSLSVLQDQLIAFEYQNRKIQNPELDGEDDLFFCSICQKDLKRMNTQRRQQHINKCCDKSESQYTQAREKEASVVRDSQSCPFCSIEIKPRKHWPIHIKRCAQKNNVPISQLLEIKNQQQEFESTSMNEGTTVRTDAGISNKPAQARKKRNVLKRNVDEETQLAMAMSASMAPPSVPDHDDLLKRQKRKRKKGNEVIPALLLRSKEETQSVIAARAAEVICTKNDDSEDESISSTPALAPSSLAQQFMKAEQANQELHVASDGSNFLSRMKIMTKETPCPTPTCISNTKPTDDATANEDTETYVAMETSVTMETSVISLSDMMDNSDMCKSFLSFLNEDEEEKEAHTNMENKAGLGSLWSLSSLNDKVTLAHSFYVPGLLPAQSPRRPRKTPRKSSTRNEQKYSSNLKNNKSTKPPTSPRKSENTEEGTVLEKPTAEENVTKLLSESDITMTASQAVNVGILVELAGSSDDEESLEPWRKSSTDHDDVFPSSGFCLPIGPDTQPIQGDQSTSSCLNVLLQDLSNMVGNASLSDVTIVTKGNHEIPAHSFMLAARSDVLADMITTAHIPNNGKQAHSEPIYLAFDDVEPEPMRCVLQFIYTATLNVPSIWTKQIMSLAKRFKLVELEKSCLASKESSQELDNDSADTNDAMKAVSAEELLDAIWQQETGEFKTNQEHSQEDWGEGFDDDDIQEVRYFQTQATRKMRTMSEEHCGQESLRNMLGLVDTCCDSANIQGEDVRDHELRDISGNQERDIEEKCDSDDDKGLSDDEVCDIPVKQICDTDLHEEGMCDTCIHEDEMRDTDRHGEGMRDIDLHGEGKRDIDLHEEGMRDTDIHEEGMRDTDLHEEGMRDIDLHEEGIRDTYLHEEGMRDTDLHEEGMRETDIHEEGMRDTDIHGEGMRDIDLHEDEEDIHEEGMRDTDIHEDGMCHIDLHEDDEISPENEEQLKEIHANSSLQRTPVSQINECDNASPSDHEDASQSTIIDKVDLTNDEIPDDDETESNVASTVHYSMYKDIDDDDDSDEHVGDVAMWNQSISLLSDDNDADMGGTSPPNKGDMGGIIPETPHPKAKGASPDQNASRSSQPSTCVPKVSSSTSGSASYYHFAGSDSDVGNEEDGEAFLEKLRANTKANRYKGKKKRQTKASKTGKTTTLGRNTSRDTEEATSTTDEMEGGSRCRRTICPSPPETLSSPGTASLQNEDDIADVSFENQIEDLMNENPTTTVDFSDNEEGKGIYFDRENFEGIVSCPSYSPVRVLSPTVPASPSYSDYDHNSPSSPIIISNVDQDEADPSSTSDVNHSPVTMPTTPGSPVIASELESRNSKFTTSDTYSKTTVNEDEREVSVPDTAANTIVSESESEKSGFTCTTLTVHPDIQPNSIEPGQSNEPSCLGHKTRDNEKFTAAQTIFSIDTKKSLFQRLRATKYGLDKDEVAVSSDEESDSSGTSSLPSQQQSKEATDPSTANPVLVNDFYDDGGYNCDVDEFAEYLQGDDSFMANAAEQLEREDQPACSRPSEACTPVNNNKTTKYRTTNNRNMNESTSPVTPIPDYNNMDTPDLRSEVNKYGIRPLPKKKMVAKLNEIGEYIRRAKVGMTSSQSASQTSKSAPKAKSRPASQRQVNSDSDDGSGPSQPLSGIRSSKMVQSKSTKSVPQKKLTTVEEDKDIKLQKTCSLQDNGSMSDGDNRSAEAGDSDNEVNEEFGEVSILIDSETVTASQQVTSNDIRGTLRSYMTNNHDIYLKVLHYQPIDLMALHEQIKSDGIQCSVGKLLDFLDEQCISFTTAGQKPRRTRKKPSRKK